MGPFRADILVANTIFLEIKAATTLLLAHGVFV
jgi:hypothetical protein